MANYENIKDYGFDKLTPNRQREIASMGGKASQRKKKQQKKLKEIFQTIGALEVTDKALFEKMEKMGIPKDEITWGAAVAVSTILNAIRKNDIKTVAFILKMIDEDEGKDSKNAFDEFMNGN